MHIYARQGDLVIDKLAKAITGDLSPRRDLVLAGDSGGHPHTLVGSVLARTEARRAFVRVAETTRIEHSGQHPDISLEPGDYEIRRLREAGDRLVED